MCGRIAVGYIERIIALTETLNIMGSPPETPYDGRPTDDVDVIINDQGKLTWQKMRWGLVPHWASAISNSYATFNAKTETLAELKSFKNAYMKQQKCIFVLSGLYESKSLDDAKSKLYTWVRKPEEELIFSAGIYEVNSRIQPTFTSCTLLTQKPSPQFAQIHNRQPVFLDQASLPGFLETFDDPAQIEHYWNNRLPYRLDAHVTQKYGSQVMDEGELIPL